MTITIANKGKKLLTRTDNLIREINEVLQHPTVVATFDRLTLHCAEKNLKTPLNEHVARAFDNLQKAWEPVKAVLAMVRGDSTNAQHLLFDPSWELKIDELDTLNIAIKQDGDQISATIAKNGGPPFDINAEWNSDPFDYDFVYQDGDVKLLLEFQETHDGGLGIALPLNPNFEEDIAKELRKRFPTSHRPAYGTIHWKVDVDVDKLDFTWK